MNQSEEVNRVWKSSRAREENENGCEGGLNQWRFKGQKLMRKDKIDRGRPRQITSFLTDLAVFRQ